MPSYYDNHQTEKKRYLRNRKNRKILSGKYLRWDLYDFYVCVWIKFAYYCMWSSYWRLFACLCVYIFIYIITISNMDSYRRVNAASAKNVGLLTWCLLQDSSKRSVSNRILTSTRLMLIWPRHLTWSVEMAFGKSRQNTAVPINSLPSLDNFMTACVQGCKTTEKAP